MPVSIAYPTVPAAAHKAFSEVFLGPPPVEAKHAFVAIPPPPSRLGGDVVVSQLAAEGIAPIIVPIPPRPKHKRTREKSPPAFGNSSVCSSTSARYAFATCAVGRHEHGTQI